MIEGSAVGVMIEGSAVGVVIDGSGVPASAVLPVDSVVSGVVSAEKGVHDIQCIHSIKSTVNSYKVTTLN